MYSALIFLMPICPSFTFMSLKILIYFIFTSQSHSLSNHPKSNICFSYLSQLKIKHTIFSDHSFPPVTSCQSRHPHVMYLSKHHSINYWLIFFFFFCMGSAILDSHQKYDYLMFFFFVYIQFSMYYIILLMLPTYSISNIYVSNHFYSLIYTSTWSYIIHFIYYRNYNKR